MGLPMAEAVAFEQFVRAHTAELLRAAVVLTGSHDAGEELLQDTLVHLYPRWDLVAAVNVPVAYVRRCMTNRFVSGVRSPRRRSITMWEVPDRWDGPDISEAIAAKREIWQLLGELSERQRAAVLLRYFYDQTDQEIAEAIGCREVTVRSLLSRAMAALRRSHVHSLATGIGD